MYDDSRRYAEAAQAAGVDATFEPWDDMFHGWHSSAHVLDEAQQAIDSIRAILQEFVLMAELEQHLRRRHRCHRFQHCGH